MKGPVPDSRCASPQRLSFFAAGPAAFRRRRGVHITGSWLPWPRRVAPGAVTVKSGPADAENGLGSRCAASAAGERQPLKLMRYTNHVGGLRPSNGRPLTPGPAPWAQAGHSGPGVPCERPGSGPPTHRAGPLQGPSHAHEPSPGNQRYSPEQPEKGKRKISFLKTGAERG